MKRISIDNGNTFVAAGEAIENVGMDVIEHYMDHEISELVIKKYACDTDEEFVEKYLENAVEDLIIG